MKLKRTIAILAALAALTGLCACAVNGPYDALSSLSGPAPAQEEKAPDQAPDVFDEPTEASEPAEEPDPTEKPKPTERPEPTSKPEPTKKPEPTEKPTPTKKPEPTAKPTPTVEPSPRPALWGTVEGNTYRNDHFGVTCKLPEGWAFLSEDELNERVTGAVEDPTFDDTGDDMRAFLAEDENACVAAAVSEDSLHSFNIVVESLSGWGEYISEKDLCAIALHQLGVEEDGDLTDLGLPGGAIEQNTVAFAGEDHPGLYLTFTDTSLGIDMPVHMQFLYLIQDGYAMQITMSSNFDEAGLADIADMFTADAAK